MKIRCPACGATNSLDSLISHKEAKIALLSAMGISGELGDALIKYLSFFRPSKTQLSFNQVAKRLNELLPSIHSQSVLIESEQYEATPQAWIYAINDMLNKRARGELKTPLKNHHYLFKVITSYQFTAQPNKALNDPTPQKPFSSAAGKGVAALQELKEK